MDEQGVHEADNLRSQICRPDPDFYRLSEIMFVSSHKEAEISANDDTAVIKIFPVRHVHFKLLSSRFTKETLALNGKDFRAQSEQPRWFLRRARAHAVGATTHDVRLSGRDLLANLGVLVTFVTHAEQGCRNKRMRKQQEGNA